MAEQPKNLDAAYLMATLEQCHVQYVVIGGMAGLFFGAQRPTEDLDLVIRRERSNLRNLADALKQLNARLRVAHMSDEESISLSVPIDELFLEQNHTTTWQTDAGPLDVLSGLQFERGSIATYDELLAKSSTVHHFGLTIVVANIDDVIRAKEFANRRKDLDALPELRRISRSSLGETEL